MQIPVTQTSKYLDTSVGVGNTIGSPVNNVGWKYMRMAVSAGDKVVVNGTGGGAARLWAFIDANGAILSVASQAATGTNLEKTAPENAAEVIINVANSQSTPSYYIQKDSISEKIEKLQSDLQNEIDEINEALDDVATFAPTIIASAVKTLTGSEEITQVILNKSCNLAVGDKITIATSGIGSGQPASAYRLYFNDETVGDYTTDKDITLEIAVTKIRISILANSIKDAGNVGFEITLKSKLVSMGDDITKLKNDFAEKKPLLDSAEATVKDISVSSDTSSLVWNAKGYYINPGGRLSSHTSYVHSKPIAVHRNDTLIFTASVASVSIIPLSWVIAEDAVYVPILVAADIENTPTEYRWKCPKDGYVAICTYQSKKGSLQIISGSDEYVGDNLVNLIGADDLSSIMRADDGNLIRYWSKKIRFAQHNTNIISSTVSSSYFSTGWVDVRGVIYIVFKGASPDKVFAFDNSYAIISVVGELRNPVRMPAGTAFVKATYAIADCPWENRDSLGIYALDAGIVTDDGYIAKKDIATFSAVKVYGSYVSETTFNNTEGEPVSLDTSEIYVDGTTGMQYRWSGTALYELGYEDGKSLAFTSGFSLAVRRNKMAMANMIVSASARYVRGNGITAVPTITFVARGGGLLLNYSTVNYTIGRDNQFSKKEWRTYPLSPSQTYTAINVTIPSGVTLFIDDFGNYYSDKKGHTGMYPMLQCRSTNTPDCSLAHIEQAVKLGYEYIIVIPKRTYDGVWVILHDDANIIATVRHEDGSALTDADLPAAAIAAGITSISSCPLSYFSYAELMTFDIGMDDDTYYQRNVGWRGQKIPTLESFFEICAKSGLHPCFSVHPNFTAEEWGEVKVMADKWGVTSRLNLKTGYITYFKTTAYTAFGDSIESYYTDVNTDRDGVAEVQSFIAVTGCDTSKVRVGIEYFEQYITDARVANAIANGIPVGKVGAGSSEEYLSWTRKGVSSFTDMHNPSVGLNW